MSNRLQHNMDKKAPAQRFSTLSPVALVVMGLVGAADALASVREALLQSQSTTEGSLSAKTTVMDYNAVASLVQALVREGMAPEEAALQVQFALQGPNPLAALSALVASVAAPTGAETAQDVISLHTLVEALAQQVSELSETGRSLDVSLLQDVVPSSAGFAQADLAQALETYKALEQGVGAAQRSGNADVAQNQIDLLLAQATQAGAAVATDAGAATAATASAGAASGAAAVGAMSAAQAIALVGFAAVAGGAFSSADAAVSSGLDLSGFVVKGPVSGGKVFLDVNGNLIQDGNEALTEVTTDSSGAYKLQNLSQFTLTSSSKVVAIGGTDTVTGNTLGTLAAPTGAKVVTPLTTLLAANPSLSAADLKTVLGLTYDPLTYNPFATGVSSADKLAAEGLALQINTLMNSLSGTVAASGVSISTAFKDVASNLAKTLLDAKGTSLAGSTSFLSDSSSTLLSNLANNIKSAYSTLDLTAITSSTTAAATVNNSIKTAVNDAITGKGTLDAIKGSLTSALGSVPVANPSLLPDKTVAEDSALSGTGGTGSLSTLPSTFTATNISSANLLTFFDNNKGTVGQAPTLTFDMTGYAVTDRGDSSLDLVVSLQKKAFAGRDLTVTLDNVKLDSATASSGSTTLTLPAQTITASVKMGSVSLGTFSFSNVDSDALTLTSGSNTVGATPSFSLKLDSLFAKMTNGVGDVLDLTTLSNKALVALGGALVVGTLDDLTPASVVAKLKGLITLPSSVDTVSELVTLAKNVIDFPEVSSLKVSDLLGQIPAGSTKTLLLTAASRANVVVDSATSDTISSALTKFSTAFGSSKLSDLSTLLSNGLGLDQGVDLVSVAKELVFAALNQAQGLTSEQILDKAIGALVDANNGDLRALLAGVDYQSVLGNQMDVLNVLNNIVQHGTVKYVDLISLGANTMLKGSDATLVVQATDFNQLAVTSNSVSVSSLQVSVPIGSASSFTPSSNGLGIAAGAFTDADSNVLKYSASLENGAALPSWLKFDATTKSFTGTPKNEDVGELNIKITATDPVGNKTSDVFKLTVTNVNDAPELVSGATTTATAMEFGSASFDVSKAFNDVDVGDVLTYSAASGTTLPPGWKLTDAGILSGTVPENTIPNNVTQAFTKTIKITATDKAGASVTQDFNLTITNDTTAPANLTPTLVEDNGTNTSDWITGNGRISINSTVLESGAKWFSSVKGVSTEQTGKTYFDLPVGTYAADDVKVYQQDQAGNSSAVQTSLGKALTVVAAPGAPTITITDSGAADGITNVKSVGVTLTDGATTWAYSLKGAAYVTGSGTSFNLVDGTTYAAGDIKVKQYNAAGISGSLEASNSSTLKVDQTSPTVQTSFDSIDANGVYTLKFVFSESVTDFAVSDIDVPTASLSSFSGSGATYTVLATPSSSTTSTTMTVKLAAGVATDTAGNGNTAAADVFKYVLYGTNSADTLTGGDNPEVVYGKDGNDSITAGAGVDTIWGGSGNDTVIGGAGADTINLGDSADGVDILKITAITDSTLASADTVSGFGQNDKIDLTTLLKTIYSAENTINMGDASSPLQFGTPIIDLTLRTATVPLKYVGTEAAGIKDLFLSLNVDPDIASSFAVKLTDSDFGYTPILAAAAPDVAILYVSRKDDVPATGNTVAKVYTDTFVNGETVANLEFGLSETATSFIFEASAASVSGVTVVTPKTVFVGLSSLAVASKYSVIDDGVKLSTTIGDNEIHFAQSSTGGVDIQYDTAAAIGTSSVTASAVIHLEGITALDLTKNDFVFV